MVSATICFLVGLVASVYLVRKGKIGPSIITIAFTVLSFALILVFLSSCSSTQALHWGDRVRVISITNPNKGRHGIVASNMMKDRFGNNSWCFVRFDSSAGLSGIMLVDLIKDNE